MLRLIWCLFFTPLLTVSAAEWNIYIGGYTHDAQSGISICQFNDATGRLSPARVVAATPNPSFLALSPDGKHLYAVGEQASFQGKPGGGVYAFSREAGGDLKPLNAVPSRGESPCHITLSADGKFVLVANYGTGSVCAYSLNSEGAIDHQTALVQHSGRSINPHRQTSPHAHQVEMTPDGHHVLVADLGLDKVMIYRLDPETGQLAAGEPASLSLTPGAGPRHVVFDTSGRHLYVINELDNTITGFDFDANAVSPSPFQTLSTLPAGFTGTSSAAEIAIHPNGRFLYASNRGHNSIAAFGIDSATGRLSDPTFTSTADSQPRHFAIAPDGHWLLVANQVSHSISVFSLDPTTGALTFSSDLKDITGDPACLLFAKSPVFPDLPATR